MDTTVSEVLQFVRENDVKFVRLVFCDVCGTIKNIAVTAEELPRAFEAGITFDASAIRGFTDAVQSDLLLFPDPSTLAVLPWRPQQGRVARFFCSIRHPDGRPFEGDTRAVLQQAAEELRRTGLSCRVGAECEFYLFETDDWGKPTRITQDEAGYLDVAPLDKGENVRRDICLMLEQMGLRFESSHHEQGPGQNEIDFRFNDALAAADDLTAFKIAVKAVAARNGLFASFMPKPVPEASGSGLHLNLSLTRGGQNIFVNAPDRHSPEAESFIAGILDHIREMTAFLNPLPNSYERLGRMEAPRYITWSHENRSQLIRIPSGKGDFARMELRSPDPACNPYVAYTLLLRAGLDGIRRQLPLCPSCNVNLYTADPQLLAGLEKLPLNMEEAIMEAKESAFIRDALPEKIRDGFFTIREEECRLCAQADNPAEMQHKLYFRAI